MNIKNRIYFYEKIERERLYWPKILPGHNVTPRKVKISSFVSHICLFIYLYIYLFLSSTVLVSKSRRYAIVGYRWVQIFIFRLCYYFIHQCVCDSCDSFYLNKWEGINTLYRQTEGPANALKPLSACGRWCMEKPSCTSLAWDPGSCWQISFCGTPIVTGKLYYLTKDPVGLYMMYLALYTMQLYYGLSSKQLLQLRANFFSRCMIDVELVYISLTKCSLTTSFILQISK